MVGNWMIHWLVFLDNCFTGWMSGWLTGEITNCPVGWFIGKVDDCLTASLIPLNGCPAEWMVSCLADQVSVWTSLWLAEFLPGWLAKFLPGWPSLCLAGWPSLWLAKSLPAWLAKSLPGRLASLSLAGWPSLCLAGWPSLCLAGWPSPCLADQLAPKRNQLQFAYVITSHTSISKKKLIQIYIWKPILFLLSTAIGVKTHHSCIFFFFDRKDSIKSSRCH